MRPEDLIIKPKCPLDPVQVLDHLKKASESQNANEIDQAVLMAFQVGLRPEFVPSLIVILDLQNHGEHEDIVRAFQQLKDPRAVDVVYRAALVRHDYLNYDVNFGLARKCTWALADIGTEEALAKLHILAKSDNQQIAGYAQKRIDKWEIERNRKLAR
jgi:hypothetical protein